MVNQILKLTIVSVRELNQANVTADVTKKLSAATMIDGFLNSPAQECKRWLDLEEVIVLNQTERLIKEREEEPFSKCIIL